MRVLFAGVRVRKLEIAAEWYGRLFGRAADVVPNEQEVMWQVSEGGWLYVLEGAEDAGRSLVTICVDDLTSVVAELAHRNHAVGPIESVGDTGSRKAKMVDPDGNSIDLIEVPQ